MALQELVCPYCEADVPLDSDISSGDEVYCSYCHCPVIAQKLDRDRWIGIQTEEWDAIKKRRRQAENKLADEDS